MIRTADHRTHLLFSIRRAGVKCRVLWHTDLIAGSRLSPGSAVSALSTWGQKNEAVHFARSVLIAETIDTRGGANLLHLPSCEGHHSAFRGTA